MQCRDEGDVRRVLAPLRQAPPVSLAHLFAQHEVATDAEFEGIRVWEHRASAQAVCVPPLHHVTVCLMLSDFPVQACFADGRRHQRNARRGEITVLCSDEPFLLRLSQQAHLCNVSLSPRLLHQAAAQALGDGPALPTRLATRCGLVDPVLRMLVEVMHASAQRQAPGLQPLLRQMGLAMAGHLLHGATGGTGGTGNAESGPNDFQLDVSIVRVVRYLQGLLDAPCRLDELAKLVGIGPSQLNRRFKLSMGVSPKQYHLRLRLQHAIETLRSGAANVTAAALDAGFDDLPHFSRMVKQHYGQPPSAFMP